MNRGEHIGLVGANGEGKSTFLSIVTGKLIPDEGKIEWAKNVKSGYLDQHAVLEKGMTIKDVLNSAYASLYEMEQRMNELYGKMADPEEDMDALMEEAGVIQDLLTAHDAETDGKEDSADVGMPAFRHFRNQFFHNNIEHCTCCKTQ